jgi:hypothetical protein
MDEVIALLQRVPSESVDGPAAQDLLKKIQDGRAEARARADALKKDMDVLHAEPPPNAFAAAAPRPPELAPAAAPGADAGVDAGPAEPASGMSLADFNRQWGDCFEAGKQVNVVGVGLRDTYALKGYNRCRDALPGFDERLVIVDRNQVLGVVARSSVQEVAVDSGPPPAPPPAAPGAQQDAGP